MKINRVSIFVLNYNGIALMRECLPSLVEAGRRSPVPVRLVVIDNRSTDASVSFVRENFPTFEISVAEANDFLCSFNAYVAADTGDVALLLNNDIKVDPDFLAPLITLFEKNEDAFFASPLCWDFSGQHYEGGLSRLMNRAGIMGTRSVMPPLPADGTPLLTASIGAAIAVRRDRFLALGGFDRLFLPGILEDLDLCYRGWKRGWRGYLVRESMAYHKGQASFQPAFGAYRVRKMACCHTFLFMWKNLSDFTLLAEHALLLLPRLAWSLVRGDLAFGAGLMEALGRLSEAMERRRGAQEGAVLSDREILKLTGAPS
ncbi:MAG TPA: glycosyltransferase [Verrucomicrobiae bacterium]|nr:glycosyltransferase [Verrucomicrobiae bacterium]